MKNDANYSIGHIAVLLAGDLYCNRSKEIIAGRIEDDSVDYDRAMAATYLSGLIDMATLYLGVISGDDFADHLKFIDNKISGILDGSYGRDDSDGDSDEGDV